MTTTPPRLYRISYNYGEAIPAGAISFSNQINDDGTIHQGVMIPVALGEPSRHGDQVLVSREDIGELLHWTEICYHVDNHGYCQTHGLGDVDEDRLCGIGRLVDAYALGEQKDSPAVDRQTSRDSGGES